MGVQCTYGNARGIGNENFDCFCLFVCSVFHVFPVYELCSVYCTQQKIDFIRTYTSFRKTLCKAHVLLDVKQDRSFLTTA